MRPLPPTPESVLGSPLRNLAVIVLFVLATATGASVAYRLAGWSWSDAIYMVTLTLYTVGYGEVRPVDTPYLHIVTVTTMVLGCTGMIMLTGVLVQVFTAIQLRQLFGQNRMQSQIDQLSGHVIVCGYGRIGVMLAKDLGAAHCPLVVVERNPGKILEASALGLLTISGDASDEATLMAAGVARARVLATVLPDDAANVFITLTARSLNPELEIIARGEAPTTENKLLHAGASRVVLPTHIGAERIAEMILFPDTEGFLREREGGQDFKREMSKFGLEVEVATAVADGALTGLSVTDAERQAGGAFFIVQLDKADGRSVAHPGPDLVVEAGDSIVLVVRAGRVAAGTRFSTPRGPIRVGRSVR